MTHEGLTYTRSCSRGESRLLGYKDVCTVHGVILEFGIFCVFQVFRYTSCWSSAVIGTLSRNELDTSDSWIPTKRVRQFERLGPSVASLSSSTRRGRARRNSGSGTRTRASNREDFSHFLRRE
ncbi:hypothetical protein PR048_024574 [Dryococelus australis]|uniref:Uncharacterized protein n=1 Tax=Dryococelus australis TaxID=614101 RepID=A0ABQ9GNX8_9NEOP|nr:hypothetical protein PR048_024574 [Dryococelus australis]